MNRRFLVILSLALANALAQAQEKGSAAKGDKAGTPAEKPGSTPKVLMFKPDARAGDGLSDIGTNSGVVVQRSNAPGAVPEGPTQIVATFFAALHEGKIDEGYSTLTKGSKIAEKPEELRQLKVKTREAIDVFGTINGYDFVESRAIGARLVRATYVSQGKVFPLRWRFYFYKPEAVWRLIDMRVDDKLTGIFDEADEPKSPDQKSSELPSQ
jgi:hypothetical protein